MLRSWLLLRVVEIVHFGRFHRDVDRLKSRADCGVQGLTNVLAASWYRAGLDGNSGRDSAWDLPLSFQNFGSVFQNIAEM
jgi:hypothetical protein